MREALVPKESHLGLCDSIAIADIEGLNSPIPLKLEYNVPQGCIAGVRYVRAGSTVPEMLNITLS